MVKGAIASNINISFSMPGGKGYELRQVSGKITFIPGTQQ